MPGLLLILTRARGERFSAAMELAATSAALGRPVAVLLRGSAVQARKMAVVDTLLDLGAHIAVCQTAMADRALSVADLPPGVQPLGLVAFLAGREDWQLVLA